MQLSYTAAVGKLSSCEILHCTAPVSGHRSAVIRGELLQCGFVESTLSALRVKLDRVIGAKYMARR